MLSNINLGMLYSNPALVPSVGLWLAALATYVTRDFPLSMWHFIKAQITTSIHASSSEPEFEALTRWVEAQGFTKRFRTLRARQNVLSAGFGRHFFIYKYRPCWFYRGRVDKHMDVERELEEVSLSSIGRGQEFLRGLVREALSHADKKDKTKIYVPRWGSWSLVSSQPKRPLESIMLSNANQVALSTHVERFFKSEKWYRDHGIPFRTGICLYGPPGTGKTSLVRAICSEYDLDLYNLDITNSSDQVIKEVIWRVGKTSVLLIEDIDTVRASNCRSKERKPLEEQKLTLGGLLNAIDGVLDSDGRVLIMTTNHIEKLDPALLRTGRIDLRIEMGFMTDEMFRATFNRMFPGFTIPVEVNWISKLSPADFQRHLLENQGDPEKVFALVSAPLMRKLPSLCVSPQSSELNPAFA